MQQFFVNVMISVLENPQVQALLRQLFMDATDKVSADLTAELHSVEDKLVTALEAMPGVILGDATKDVGILLREIVGTKDEIAGEVKAEVQPLFNPLVDLLKNLPGGGILGGIFGR